MSEYWKCKACGSDDYWFDRTIEIDSEGNEDGPFIRCSKCGEIDEE